MSDFRWKHFAAMALIGDGVMAMVRPDYDAQAWSVGPRGWKRLMRGLRKHRGLTRVLGGMELAGGICLALASEKSGRRFAPPQMDNVPEADDLEASVPVR